MVGSSPKGRFVYVEDLVHEVLLLWQSRRQKRLADLKDHFALLSPDGKDDDLIEITYHQLFGE